MIDKRIRTDDDYEEEDHDHDHIVDKVVLVTVPNKYITKPNLVLLQYVVDIIRLIT